MLNVYIALYTDLHLVVMTLLHKGVCMKPCIDEQQKP